MIPESVQKMIEEEAGKFIRWQNIAPSEIERRNAFIKGASISYELGFSQGIEAVCKWLNTFGYTEDHMSNIADSIKQHFKDRGRE